MLFLNKIKTKKKFDLFLILAIISSVIVLISSCIKYIYFGSINWDEPLQIKGVEEHLNFALTTLKGEGESYKIIRNMAWYGIGLKFIYAAPMLVVKKIFGDESRFLQFATLRGWALFIYLFSGIVFYYTSNFYQKKKSKILAFVYFTFPFLAGESYLNITDIPMAICFSFYSLFNGMIVLSKQKKLTRNKNLQINRTNKNKFMWNQEKNIFFYSILMAAFLINSKATMLAPVIIIESCLALYLFENKGIFYQKCINFVKKLCSRFIYIIGITYLITPPAWINPFKYYYEVIRGFAKFDGNYFSKIAGVQFATNTDSWNLFEYLWRWFQIKIPIIMMLLVILFFLYCLYQLIFKNKIKNIYILQNPLLIFYLLQLTITPVLAILANSSTYNVLRHWCFIYTPLIIFTSFFIDNILLNSESKIFNNISKVIVGLFAVLGITDNVMLMPYSNLSFNTYGRRFVKEENTDIDYWGYSAGELLKSDVIEGYQVRSFAPPFRVGFLQEEFNHSPHHIKFENHKYPFASASHTRGGFSHIKENCKRIDSVKRNLLFRKEPLEMSVLGICPIFDGDSWRIWTLKDGQIKIQSTITKDTYELPKSVNPWDLKRVNVSKEKDRKLSMVFLENGEFTIRELKLNNEKIYYDAFEIPPNEELPDYIDKYLIPSTVVFNGRHDLIREWELGFKKSNLNPTIFYSNDVIDLISLDEQYVGIVCKRKGRRAIRTILKNKFNELMHKPYGKAGSFSFTKAECLFNENNNLQKVFLLDSDGNHIYRWEVDKDGVQIKSEMI